MEGNYLDTYEKLKLITIKEIKNTKHQKVLEVIAM